MKIGLKTEFVNSVEKFSKRASTNLRDFVQKIAVMRRDVEQPNKERTRN